MDEENIDETRKSFIEKKNQTGLMSKKYKLPWTLSSEYFLVLASAVTGNISISVSPSLVGMPIGIAGSAVGLNCLFNNCEI